MAAISAAMMLKTPWLVTHDFSIVCLASSNEEAMHEMVNSSNFSANEISANRTEARVVGAHARSENAR